MKIAFISSYTNLFIQRSWLTFINIVQVDNIELFHTSSNYNLQGCRFFNIFLLLQTTWMIYTNEGLLIGDAYDDLDLHIPQHSKGPAILQLLLTNIHSQNSINGNSIQWKIIVTIANINGDLEQKMWSIVILGRIRFTIKEVVYKC